MAFPISRIRTRFPSLGLVNSGCRRVYFDNPGGTQIAMGVLQGILNAVDFDMNMQDAISAPRVSATSNAIDISNRVTRRTQAELEKMGYQVIRSPLSYTFAWVHGIRIQDSRMDGGADPATDGMALAV